MATMAMDTRAAVAAGPERIMQLAFGFGVSKTLLSAVELGVFTELAKGPLPARDLAERLGIHPRASLDFFDALVAMGLLEKAAGLYFNRPEAEYYLDRSKSTYVGGMLEMANARLYGSWGSLTEALRTGKPQNEVKNGQNPFDTLYSDPARLRGFLSAMTGFGLAPARAIAQKFPWERYSTFADIGTAQGCVPVRLALQHDHLEGIGYDMPIVGPVFEEYVESFGLQSRVRFLSGDFLKEPLPSAEVLIMGHILHDWGMEDKRMLLEKAYAALPRRGALIVFESLIDNERRTNLSGLMMSLNMLIETPAGFDYTGADCERWMRETGFPETWVEHLEGSESMVVAIK
jgi:hypothetical protein